MGYKRAGFTVLGNVEIDKDMNKLYVMNQHPKYNYNMDLREFNRMDNLPEELYHLEILDGSPPCSTFSMSGHREKGWGVKKQFREGQAKQTLDDLFFVWLDTVEKLQPKISVAENVIGLMNGNAKGYINMIIKRFHEIGYKVQLFKLNAAYMEVPQARERIFFIANNQNFPKLKLNFSYKPIPFGKVRSKVGTPISDGAISTYLKHMKPQDVTVANITQRLKGKWNNFSHKIIHDDWIASTVTSGGGNIRACDKMWLSKEDIINISTFPQDYNFGGQKVQYVCGMCVPPNMMANIALEIWKQWLREN